MSERHPPAVAVALPVVVEAPDEDGESMGLFGGRDRTATVRRIPVDTLRESLESVVGALRTIFAEANVGPGLPLREAQVSVEISASGEVRLLGVGGQIGATGAITLTFGG